MNQLSKRSLHPSLLAATVFAFVGTWSHVQAQNTPGLVVERQRPAALISVETLDQSLRRGGRRGVLDQWWIPQSTSGLGFTDVGQGPAAVRSDGADLWVAHREGGTVQRVRASDGRVLETWTGAIRATGVLVAAGRVFLSSGQQPGRIFVIDPSQPAGAVTQLATNLGAFPSSIAFDGSRLWTANPGGFGDPSSVSIVTLNPVTVTNVTTGFSQVRGILYDGANIWVTDQVGTLLKLDENGTILQTVSVDSEPRFPTFDGMNIWVPSQTLNRVTVVQAATGTVLLILTGNGLDEPVGAAFDGQRILVTNFGGNSVSIWNAADATPVSSVSTGTDTGPFGVCSDGLNFWVTLLDSNQLVRF